MPTSSWALRSGSARGVNTGTWGHRKNIVGAYFQDDWRATDTLTLNLGMRWEYHTPLYEVKDRQSNFEPFTGKLLLAGQDGNSRALYNGYWKDFQPRSASPGRRASSRAARPCCAGAYTISSFMEGTGTNLRLPLNPPFNVEFETLYDKGDALLVPQSNISQGLTVLQALDPFKGVNIRLWDPNVRPANVQQWSLIVERQLPSGYGRDGRLCRPARHASGCADALLPVPRCFLTGPRSRAATSRATRSSPGSRRSRAPSPTATSAMTRCKSRRAGG